MDVTVRAYRQSDLPDMIRIWNEVVEEGVAFPQEEPLDGESGSAFFAAQTYSAVACEPETGKIVGLYILHPNNVGRCGHICNASYAVSRDARGLRAGRRLVSDSLIQGAAHGFRILQFNAVVKSNTAALRLYEKLGFVRLGTIPGGFLNGDGEYEDIIVHYHLL